MVFRRERELCERERGFEKSISLAMAAPLARRSWLRDLMAATHFQAQRHLILSTTGAIEVVKGRARTGNEGENAASLGCPHG